MQVESKIGAIFLVLLSAFLVGVMFVVLKNANSDSIVLAANETQVKTMSSTERQLIANWIKENNIELPEGEGYRSIERKYPEKPWLKD